MKKNPSHCQCETCVKNQEIKKKCSDCGKMSVRYVHAIGWECLNKRCKTTGTFSDLFDTMSKLAKSEKLRKKVERDFKKRGMNIKIDGMGVGHLILPLHISSKIK